MSHEYRDISNHKQLTTAASHEYHGISYLKKKKKKSKAHVTGPLWGESNDTGGFPS